MSRQPAQEASKAGNIWNSKTYFAPFRLRKQLLQQGLLGSFRKRDDLLPVGIAFQNIRIISLRIGTVIPVTFCISAIVLLNITGRRRLDDYRLRRIRIIGGVRIKRIIRRIRGVSPKRRAPSPCGGTKHNPDRCAGMMMVVASVGESAFANEARQTAEKQEYYGTSHNKAFSPYTRETRLSPGGDKGEPIQFYYPLFGERATSLKDFVTK